MRFGGLSLITGDIFDEHHLLLEENYTPVARIDPPLTFTLNTNQTFRSLARFSLRYAQDTYGVHSAFSK